VKPTYETTLHNAENALRELIDACPNHLIESESRALIEELSAERIELIIQRERKERREDIQKIFKLSRL